MKNFVSELFLVHSLPQPQMYCTQISFSEEANSGLDVTAVLLQMRVRKVVEQHDTTLLCHRTQTLQQPVLIEEEILLH